MGGAAAAAGFSSREAPEESRRGRRGSAGMETPPAAWRGGSPDAPSDGDPPITTHYGRTQIGTDAATCGDLWPPRIHEPRSRPPRAPCCAPLTPLSPTSRSQVPPHPRGQDGVPGVSPSTQQTSRRTRGAPGAHGSPCPTAPVPLRTGRGHVPVPGPIPPNPGSSFREEGPARPFRPPHPVCVESSSQSCQRSSRGRPRSPGMPRELPRDAAAPAGWVPDASPVPGVMGPALTTPQCCWWTNSAVLLPQILICTEGSKSREVKRAAGVLRWPPQRQPSRYTGRVPPKSCPHPPQTRLAAPGLQGMGTEPSWGLQSRVLSTRMPALLPWLHPTCKWGPPDPCCHGTGGGVLGPP